MPCSRKLGLGWRSCDWLLVLSAPVVIHQATTVAVLLVDGFAEISRMSGLAGQFGIGARPGKILIWRAADLVARANNILVSRVVGRVKRRQLGHGRRNPCLQRGWVLDTKGWSVAVDNVAISSGDLSPGVQLVLRRGLSGARSTRTLLSCRVLFGETLFDGFGFPVVISNSSTVLDDSTPKLTKHGPGRHHCYLSRTVGIWEDFVCNQLFLFLDAGNDLE